jgi:hypothetical protein
MDTILSALFELGLSHQDLAHLEKLTSPEILRRLPADVRKALSYRERDHVVLYMKTFADLLEEELAVANADAPANDRRVA